MRALWLLLAVLPVLTLADQCSDIFPADATPTSPNQLDLSAVMDGQSYSNFPSGDVHYASAGSWYYNSGTLATWNSITVQAGATTWLFFEGDLTLQPNSSINPYDPARNSGGNPEDLIIIVRGNLQIGTKNVINALIYASGDIDANPQSNIVGAMTAGGSITVAGNASVTYDPDAAADFNLPGACDDGSGPQVDHYQLSYASNALTCQPQAITVTACADSACSTSYTTGPASLNLLPSGQTVTLTGSTLTQLAVRTPSSVTLAISAASPAPVNPLQCRIDGGAASSNCSLRFAESGLLLQVPDVLAARPDSLSVSAVRASDDSLSCVPAFASVTRDVAFWQQYLDPDASVQLGSQAIQLAGSPVGSAASPSSHSLSFDASGTATLAFSYADAGQMQLNARYSGSATHGDAGLLMAGSARFVSRPYGLHLSSDLECSAASIAGCPQTQVAGDDFALRIRPVAWQSDGEALTASALADNPATPNFRLSSIALAPTLVAPVGGSAGSLSLASYDHGLGGEHRLSLAQREVGIFRLTATPPAGGYFGYSIPASRSELTGRFIPARLQAAVSASLTPACGSFSYQQQWIGLSAGGALLTVSALNRQGAVTSNYDFDPFWRLATPQRAAYQSITGRSALDSRLQENGSTTALAQADTTGDGRRNFRWADQLRWEAALSPSVDDLPYPATSDAVRLSVPASSLTDADGVCLNSGGGCTGLSWDFGGSALRLGRLRFGEAYGSELQALEVPFWLESWQDNAGFMAFLPQLEDACSAPLMGAPALLAVAGAGDLQPGDLPGAVSVPPLAGQGGIRLPAPGVAGSVQAGLDGLENGLLPWLLWDAAGSGVRTADRGLATFGIQASDSPLLYQQERFR